MAETTLTLHFKSDAAREEFLERLQVFADREKIRLAAAPWGEVEDAEELWVRVFDTGDGQEID
jgi:hypothetical protein